jgi:hypothetical protein
MKVLRGIAGDWGSGSWGVGEVENEGESFGKLGGPDDLSLYGDKKM